MNKKYIKKRFNKLIPQHANPATCACLICKYRYVIWNFISKVIDKAVKEEREKWLKRIKDGDLYWVNEEPKQDK